MSRYIKERIVEEYAERFREVADVAAVNAEGIDANQMVTLRSTLRERGLDAMRIQNRLCRLAIQDGPLAGAERLFDGPTTLVWGADGIVAIAKTLSEQAKEVGALEIRGGFSQGAVLSREQIEDLSKLPGREELIGQVVGRAMGQASRVVSLLTAPASGLVSQIREVEKQAPGEAPAEEEASAEAPEAAPEQAPADETPAEGAAEGEAEEAPADEKPAEASADETAAADTQPEQEQEQEQEQASDTPESADESEPS